MSSCNHRNRLRRLIVAALLGCKTHFWRNSGCKSNQSTNQSISFKWNKFMTPSKQNSEGEARLLKYSSRLCYFFPQQRELHCCQWDQQLGDIQLYWRENQLLSKRWELWLTSWTLATENKPVGSLWSLWTSRKTSFCSQPQQSRVSDSLRQFCLTSLAWFYITAQQRRAVSQCLLAKRPLSRHSAAV